MGSVFTVRFVTGAIGRVTDSDDHEAAAPPEVFVDLAAGAFLVVDDDFSDARSLLSPILTAPAPL